jgi:uncharacterized protein (TIGR00725 family)
MAIQVAVCGPRSCSEQDMTNAYQVGQLLAERGAIVICGGGVGVMAAVARGARSRAGLVIGVRPDTDRGTASPDLSAVILTGLGDARNAVIIRSADAVIAVGGSWGTLSEVALAQGRGDVPVISLGGWRVVDQAGDPVPGVVEADTAQEAVALALAGWS